MSRVSHLLTSVVLAVVGILAGGDEAAAADPEAEPTRPDVFHQNVEWSPDGRRLAYSEISLAGGFSPEKWSIWVADAEGGNRRLVAEDALWVSWAPDGERLAFSSQRDGDSEVYVVDADGGEAVALTDHPAKDAAPAWSPSASTIAFVSDRGGDQDVWLLDVETQEVRRLTQGPAKDHNPQWAPDGRSLIFYREVGDGMDQVYTVGLDGKESRVTRDRHLNTFPSILPDGRIALVSKTEDGERRLVVVDPDGGARAPIGPAGPFFARWSPDGGSVAYLSGGWPTSSIHVMDADGTGSRRIVN